MNEYQEISNIILNEVNPRKRKGGKMPSPKLVSFLVKWKLKGVFTQRDIRRILDIEMLGI